MPTDTDSELTKRFDKLDFVDELPDIDCTNGRQCNVLVTTFHGKDNKPDGDNTTWESHRLYAVPLSTSANRHNHQKMIDEIFDKFEAKSKTSVSDCQHSSSTGTKICDSCFQHCFFGSASDVINQVASGHPQAVHFRSIPPEDFTLVTGAQLGLGRRAVPDVSVDGTLRHSQVPHWVPQTMQHQPSRSRVKCASSELTQESREQLKSMLGTATSPQASSKSLRIR